MPRTGRVLTVLLGLLALGVAGVLGVWVLWATCGLRGCPAVGDLAGYSPEEASSVVDREGEELAKLYRVRRVVVELEGLPSYVPAAFVAVEDERFWSHGGVDWRRMLGAAWANLRAGEIRQGFSTITMQLARNIFPEKLPIYEKSLSRKVAEMRVAMRIEGRYDKEEILEMYLNQIYFGSGAWGIEAAAREYFGKAAAELTLAEAALLAGLPRAPARLNPRADPDAAVARRNLVLRRMAEQGRIGSGRAERARRQPLDLARSQVPEEGREAPYFVEAVRRRLEEEFGPALYTGGYTIHTTLDREAQRAAARELERQLDAIEAGRYGVFRHPTYPASRPVADGRTAYLQGAVVIMEAETGDVLALVGGRDFADSEFNRATQARRQPGSAFKPFVYAAALAAGHPLTRLLDDTPLRLVTEGGDVWTPRNYGGSYAGAVTMREALVHSKNVATVRLARDVGLDSVADLARRMRVADSIPELPSLALGALDAVPLALTAAYAAFATLGERPEPRLVTRVEDRDGDVVWRRPPLRERVLDPAVAFLVTDVLRDVIDRGTAATVRAAGYRGEAAGKTGTTNDASDVWFIGYTPARVAAVWIGLDDPRPIVPGATGGELAAPVWARVMERIGGGAGERWRPPAGVERYAVLDGAAIDPDCPGAGALPTEYFLAGTQRVHGCAPLTGFPDSLLGVPTDTVEEEDAYDWWRRLRERLRDRDERADTAAADTLRGIGPARPDTTRPPADTTERPRREGARRDDGADDDIDLLGRPVRPSDTMSAPPDTSGRRPPGG